jgi:hypothetical protein
VQLLTTLFTILDLVIIEGTYHIFPTSLANIFWYDLFSFTPMRGRSR